MLLFSHLRLVVFSSLLLCGWCIHRRLRETILYGMAVQIVSFFLFRKVQDQREKKSKSKKIISTYTHKQPNTRHCYRRLKMRVSCCCFFFLLTILLWLFCFGSGCHRLIMMVKILFIAELVNFVGNTIKYIEC